MSRESTSYKCAECGRDLTDIIEKSNEKIQCPDCGSSKRHVFLTAEEKLNVSVATALKIKDPFGFMKQESKTWESRSNNANRPVIISKDIDRSNPDYTDFHHKVEELDEHGILRRTIHDHTKREKAKHRPTKNKNTVTR